VGTVTTDEIAPITAATIAGKSTTIDARIGMTCGTNAGSTAKTDTAATGRGI
jgi:hypothetical protein